jgi:hypothetical protein
VVVQGIVDHLPVERGVDALLGDPTVKMRKIVPESYLGLAHIVAGVMHRDGVVVEGRIELDSALEDILLQELLDADHLELFKRFGKPIFEPGPGCKVCVPSFREQNGFAL